MPPRSHANGNHHETLVAQTDARYSDNDSSNNKPKRSIFDTIKSSWAKTGIDWHTYRAMFKGALAPTIGVALFQADSYAQYFTTVGYLVPVSTILCLAIRPRAAFLQNMLFNVLVSCMAAACVVLAMYCCVQAREHTDQSNSSDVPTSGAVTRSVSTAPYNSNASAVAGVWLVVFVYALATLRAKYPQHMIASILGSIMVNVGMIYAPQLPTMTAALTFMRTFLSALLTGFAIATGVALLIFPTTNRTVLFEDVVKYVDAMRASLRANIAYARSLEHGDMFTAHRTATDRHRLQQTPEVEAVKAKMQALSAMNAKFGLDLTFAKREIAFGYLGPDDLQRLGKCLRMIFLPNSGLSCLADIFQREAEDKGWDADLTNPDVGVDTKFKLEAINEWHELVRLVRQPIEGVADLIDQGLEHSLVVLRLTKPSPPVEDTEAQASNPRVGDERFSQYFSNRSSELHESRKQVLIGYCKLHGIDVPSNYFDNPLAQEKESPEWMRMEVSSDELRRMRRQLYLLLYMEFLMWSVARRTLELIVFAEELKTSGKLNRKRLVVPGSKRMIKWIKSWASSDEEVNGEHTNEEDSGLNSVQLGQALQGKKDPMHLPPQNAWERAGDRLRAISRFLGSPESVFGFRVACATMSIAIVSYLQPTQIFYTQQRLFWAQIMVAIGMQPSAGVSLRTSIFRIIGTASFMVLSLVAWYTVDEKAPGIIILYFIFLHAGPWIIVKRPPYTTLGVIGPITATLIVGYELQVLKLGLQAAESNGQLYYPVYELGAIRLATVIGGLFLGWIWTIFPYPVSEHKQQKDALATGLYLIANYHSIVLETVRLRLRGLDSDPTIKGNVVKRLEKARQKLFSKCTLVTSGLRTRAAFIKYDIPIGGRFPREQYEQITTILQGCLNYISLISYSSTTFDDLTDGKDASASEWLMNFRKLVREANATSHTVTTLLSLMAASVGNGQPLPPNLEVPEPFRLSKRLDALDRDILSLRHVAEPGYSSFAVTQIATKSLIDEIKKLLPAIKELVGELDFSFQLLEKNDGLIWSSDQRSVEERQGAEKED